MIALSGSGQPGLISVSHDTVCSAQVIDASFTNCSHQQHSLSFNNSYAEIANSTKYNFGVNQNFTIELWVNSSFIDVTAVPSHGQWLFGKGGNSWNPHYQVGIQRNSGLPRISISDGNSSTVVQFNGTMSVCDGQWHHVAYVFNRTSDSIQIIIDGVLNATGSIAIVGNAQNSAPVGFGAIYYGLMDDLRVWNTARTVAQVDSLRNQLINPANHPDLIGHYDFNEGTGNLIYDCAPNPENGMFIQFPTWSSQSALPGNLTFPLTWSNGSAADSTQFLLTSDTTIWAHSGFCKYECTDTVNLYLHALTVTSAISASCFGTNNGTATVTASGGSFPYSYLWNTGDTTSALSNLTAGQYQVMVTDASGCIASINTTVTQNTAISAIMVQDNVDCFGGSNGWASLNVAGGTPPYSYLWNTGNTTSALTNVTAGTYQVTVTDVYGCTIDNQVTITEPTELVVMVDVLPPDTAVANVTGGSPPYTYLWMTQPPQTTQTATGLSPGSYTVIVSDGNGCYASWDFMISMEELDLARYIELYPNPPTDEVFIKYNFTSEVDLEVTVVNHLGQVVLTISESNAVSGKLRLDVAEWAGGIYSVLFSNGSQSNSRQLVIRK